MRPVDAQRVIQSSLPGDWGVRSERIAAAMMRCPDGWITWLAIQADVAGEKARRS